MALLVQPVNERGLLCFSSDRTFETKDTLLAMGVEGICTATLKTANRTEDRYCLELTLDEPWVCPDGIVELVELVNRLSDALGILFVHYLLGPERRGAGNEAATFGDWVILRKS